MSFAKQRVTDTKSNRRLIIPEPAKDAIEVNLANMKNEVIGTAVEFREEFCDSKGNIKDTNLTKDECAGIKNLKRKVTNSEILIVPMDKSGMLSVTTPKNYVESMQPHIRNDVVISWEEK